MTDRVPSSVFAETIVLDKHQFEAYSPKGPSGNLQGDICDGSATLSGSGGGWSRAQHYAHYMVGILQLDLGDFPATEKTVNQLETNFSDRPEGLAPEGCCSIDRGNMMMPGFRF